MKPDEIERLTAYLRKLFKQENLAVIPRPEDKDKALVAVDKQLFAHIERDEEDGETSYNFSKDIPDQPPEEMTEYFREIFKSKEMNIQSRPNDSESAEIYKGKEFLGVLFDNEGAEGEGGENMQAFNMAILDDDLTPGDE